jgi:hypothetical protein
MTTPHILHPRDPRQSVCGIPAEAVRRWETEDTPRTGYACEDCLTQLPDAARPDDANHPIGDATLIDTLRRVVAEQQHAKIDGVLIDLWSASVTVLIWDHLRDEHRQRILTLPAHELILWCTRLYTRLNNGGGAQ